jgi:N-acetylmuramoyl-L-alanine amidase
MDIGVDTIRDWHVNGNGWSDIGYNVVITRSGEIQGGRDLDGDGDFYEETGAHARGFNTTSIGICLVGGMTADKKGAEFNFTRPQMISLEAIVNDIRSKIGTPVRVVGHRDLDPSKECPCFGVKEYFGEV